MTPSKTLSGCGVVIPTFSRSDKLILTLREILSTHPAPREIFVHVDAGDTQTQSLLDGCFAGKATWIQSTSTQGPGGGRNLLVQMATSPFLLSLDDDSWPIDKDFFQKAVSIMEQNPKAGIIATSVTVAGSEVMPAVDRIFSVSNFENCGCVIRTEAFLQTRGFLPLRYAYGMEEADLSLQILDNGWDILHSDALRVFHDTKMSHHASPQVNAAHITNTALLAFLRYPKRYWPLGIAQVSNRVRYAAMSGRFRGIASGLAAIPATCWKYRKHRQPVRPQTLRKSRSLR